jgi:hypothetical protein
MHVLTTAPFPHRLHRYCTSPIRLLAQHACAHHGALSPQVTQVLHIADPRARSACMCSPRRPFPTGTAHRRSACSRNYRGDSQSQVQARRLSQRRGVVPAAASRVGLPSASLAAIGRLAGPMAMSEICGLKARMMRTFARLQEITIPFRGLRRQNHPPSHPPYAGDETQPGPRTRERNAAPSRARRDRAAAADFPSSVRFLKRASRQPYLRSHIWIHSVVVDSSCLAKPLL